MKQGSKYWPLYDYLQKQYPNTVTLTFTQIESILGTSLPASARKNRSWWSNRSQGSWHTPTWMNVGYHTSDVDVEKETITFYKPGHVYNLRQKDGELVWDNNAVKVLRQYMEMTQAEFADTLRVRQQTISEWERGIYAPSRAMSNYLNMIAEKADFKYGTEDES